MNWIDVTNQDKMEKFTMSAAISLDLLNEIKQKREDSRDTIESVARMYADRIVEFHESNGHTLSQVDKEAKETSVKLEFCKEFSLN